MTAQEPLHQPASGAASGPERGQAVVAPGDAARVPASAAAADPKHEATSSVANEAEHARAPALTGQAGHGVPAAATAAGEPDAAKAEQEARSLAGVRVVFVLGGPGSGKGTQARPAAPAAYFPSFAAVNVHHCWLKMILTSICHAHMQELSIALVMHALHSALAKHIRCVCCPLQNMTLWMPSGMQNGRQACVALRSAQKRWTSMATCTCRPATCCARRWPAAASSAGALSVPWPCAIGLARPTDHEPCWLLARAERLVSQTLCMKTPASSELCGC